MVARRRVHSEHLDNTAAAVVRHRVRNVHPGIIAAALARHRVRNVHLDNTVAALAHRRVPSAPLATTAWLPVGTLRKRAALPVSCAAPDARGRRAHGRTRISPINGVAMPTSANQVTTV